MAVNCRVRPIPMEPTGGVTVMPNKTAGVTVNAAVPGVFVEGSVAVMVTAPMASPVAKPWEPGALETVAVAFFDDDQVTLSVRFSVRRSERVPVAMNCSVCPIPTVRPVVSP